MDHRGRSESTAHVHEHVFDADVELCEVVDLEQLPLRDLVFDAIAASAVRGQQLVKSRQDVRHSNARHAPPPRVRAPRPPGHAPGACVGRTAHRVVPEAARCTTPNTNESTRRNVHSRIEAAHGSWACRARMRSRALRAYHASDRTLKVIYHLDNRHPMGGDWGHAGTRGETTPTTHVQTRRIRVRESRRRRARGRKSPSIPPGARRRPPR